MDLVKISSDVMVSFLEFILENPQTNSAHAFKAFQQGELGSEEVEEIEEGESVEAEYEFEEMVAPEVDYEDEYESDFYTNFDDDAFNTHNWTTSWDDPHMSWVQQAHLDANHGFNAIDNIVTTTNPSTTTTTEYPRTSPKILIPKPAADTLEVEDDELTVTWLKSKNAELYEIKLYERSTRRLISRKMSTDDYITFDDLAPETEYAATVSAINSAGESSEETELVVRTSPAPPTITSSNIGPTQIRIHWSRISSALSYVVTVLDDNNEQVFSDFKFPSFDSMDVKELFPNTEYTIIVTYHLSYLLFLNTLNSV